MSGTIDRRGLMGAAAAMAAAFALPSAVRAQSPEGIGGYFERLRARVQDAGGGRFLPIAEDALLGEHNQFRESQGLGRLTRHPSLDEAARAQAADMVERNYFAHEAPEGFSSVQRVGLFARRFVGLAGENLVEVTGGPPSSADELAHLWRGSPGHRANMLRPRYSHVGFGVARKGDRTVAAAAFGETYAELAAPVAFRIDDLDAVRAALGQGSSVRGYALAPVGGGRTLGPFWLEDPPPAIEVSGAFSIKPYLSDHAAAGRFIIVDGPIIEAV